MADKLTERFLEQLENKRKKDHGIHLKLDGAGLIHMERRLPFLLVYRPFENEKDLVIENLVKNEASYMICSAHKFPEYRKLLKKLVKNLSDEFGAFLIIEIWSDRKAGLSGANTAGFELFGPRETISRTTNPLKNYIDNMDLAGLIPRIEIHPSDTRCPAQLDPLLERKVLKQWECLLFGLKIEPFYMDTKKGIIYPLLERKLYSEFSLVLKKSVFNFVKVQTSHNISGFQSLSRRKAEPEIWKIDKELVDIDSQIEFLMLISPVNSQRAWKEFKKNNYKKSPVFHYRMIPSDPELLKRTLYNIRIEDIDDPTLGILFREKRAEVDKMLSMLIERESKDFYYSSLQLFGAVSDKLFLTAEEILKEFPVDGQDDEDSDEEYLNAKEFAELATQEFMYLHKQYHEVEIRVEIKDSIDNMMVDKGVFNIPAKSKTGKKRAMALIQHEIGTHVLTYYNGKSQPLKLLSSGISGYEELQEGIAVLAEYLSGGLSKTRMQVLAARVLAVDSLINHYDFVKTFELLIDEYHFDEKTAFNITTRVYRGGGFTKDAIYLRGLNRLLSYLKNDNSLEPLLIGKIRHNYLPVINELISRKILNPLKIKPKYLSDPESLMKLSEIKGFNKVTDLISN